MSQYQHQVGRGDAPHVERNRAYEHQLVQANRRIDQLVEETRATFGPGTIHSAQINDCRRHLSETEGLPGLERLIAMFEYHLRIGQPPLMNWWTDD